MIISHSIPLRMRNTWDNVLEIIKTQIFYSISFFRNRVIYETMWKNTVEPGRPQMTIWRMRIACWIAKATHSLTTYSTYLFSTAKIVSRRARMLRCTALPVLFYSSNRQKKF